MTTALYTECPKIRFTQSIVIRRKHYIPSVPKFTLPSPLSYDENIIYRMSQNSLYPVHCHKMKTLYTECPKIRFTQSTVIRRKHYIPSVPKFTLPSPLWCDENTIYRVSQNSLYPVHCDVTKTLYTEYPKIYFTQSIAIRRKHYIPSVPNFTLPSPLSYDENTIYRVSQNSLHRVRCHLTKTLYIEHPKFHFTEFIVVWRKHYKQSVPKFALPSHYFPSNSCLNNCRNTRSYFNCQTLLSDFGGGWLAVKQQPVAFPRSVNIVSIKGF